MTLGLMLYMKIINLKQRLFILFFLFCILGCGTEKPNTYFVIETHLFLEKKDEFKLIFQYNKDSCLVQKYYLKGESKYNDVYYTYLFNSQKQVLSAVENHNGRVTQKRVCFYDKLGQKIKEEKIYYTLSPFYKTQTYYEYYPNKFIKRDSITDSLSAGVIHYNSLGQRVDSIFYILKTDKNTHKPRFNKKDMYLYENLRISSEEERTNIFYFANFNDETNAALFFDTISIFTQYLPNTNLSKKIAFERKLQGKNIWNEEPDSILFFYEKSKCTKKIAYYNHKKVIERDTLLFKYDNLGRLTEKYQNGEHIFFKYE
jgi:hypothetical protein